MLTHAHAPTRTFASSTRASPSAFADKIPVKVVIVALFERGEITGDQPGEFQLWAERYPLPEKIDLPHGNRDLYWNEEDGVLGMVTGIGTAKAAASTMALGLDPRFDFSKAYWLLAGIAGYDPEDASLGSACWVDWVVDGDLSHSIDIREAPEGWPTDASPFAPRNLTSNLVRRAKAPIFSSMSN